jgi:hypothetical protein
MNLPARLLTVLLAATATTAAADTWTRTSEVGNDPLTRTIKEKFELGATGSIEVRNIGGEVKVEAVDGSSVEMVYERQARSQQDMDCETLEHELKDGRLRISVEPSRERRCRMIYASDMLTLKVPRGASFEARSIGDSVTVSGVEGLVRLSSIGDTATITDARQVEADSIGDSIKLDVRQLGDRGIRLRSIGDSVDLTLPERIDARLRITSVGDEIRGPGLRWSSGDDDHHRGYEGVLGKGGPTIRIDSVGDTVTIRGPELREDRKL